MIEFSTKWIAIKDTYIHGHFVEKNSEVEIVEIRITSKKSIITFICNTYNFCLDAEIFKQKFKIIDED